MATDLVPANDYTLVPTEYYGGGVKRQTGKEPTFCLSRSAYPSILNHFEGRSGPWNASEGCIDWQSTQWQASFKGVPFAVDTDTRSGGRRIHVHEFPDRELWANEDLGRLRQQVDVVGYVTGDRSDEWAEILFAACTSPGYATLYLPMRVPMPAHCIQVKSSFNAERMGRIDFNMRFTLEAEFSLQTQTRFLSLTKLRNDVARTAQRVDVTARTLFEVQFTAQHASQASRTAAAGMIRRTADRLRNTAAQSRMDRVNGAILAFVVRRMDTTATELAHAQRSTANTLTNTAMVLSQQPPSIQPGAASIAGLLRASTDQVIPARGGANEGFGGLTKLAFDILRDGAQNPSDLAAALKPLTELHPRELAAARQPAAGAASVQEELRLAEVAAGYVRRTALARQCISGVKVAPAYQPDASLMRRRLLELIDEEVLLTGSYVALRDALRELRAAIVAFTAYFSQGGQGSVTLSGSKTGKPLASIAATLGAGYTDDQLMRHNDIEHPLFAPNTMVAIKT